MNIEKTILNLVDAVDDKYVKPDRLAHLYMLLLSKLGDESPAGEEALKIVQAKLSAIGGSSKISKSTTKEFLIVSQERKKVEDEMKMAVRRLRKINQRQSDEKYQQPEREAVD